MLYAEIMLATAQGNLGVFGWWTIGLHCFNARGGCLKELHCMCILTHGKGPVNVYSMYLPQQHCACKGLGPVCTLDCRRRHSGSASSVALSVVWFLFYVTTLP